MWNKVCPICNEQISFKDKYYVLPLEKPYINLLIHRTCYPSVDEFLKNIHDYSELLKFIK